MKDMIVILDFGSQYTQLIARRLREASIYCEILAFNTPLNAIKTLAPKGIILSGGPASVYEKDAYFPDLGIFDLGVPLLGICYGMQVIAHHFGGKIERSNQQEFGKSSLEISLSSALFSSMSHYQNVWMSHADKLSSLPANFNSVASSQNSEFAAIENTSANIYAVQFHPEVAHTPSGRQMLKNFAVYVCQINPNWTMQNFLSIQAKEIKAQTKGKKVLCALSGGVDSSVVAMLLHKVIGKDLIAVFVDHGLLRKNEAAQVDKTFKDLGLDLITINAKDLFLKRLKGITDPEQKRKIIGHSFIEVFEQEAKKHSDVAFLAQGTLYPDVIESVSIKGPSKTIKSHHNVGGLPEKMNLKLIEPLKELFKDEVRKLGLELGLPAQIIERHPFPGPGLAVRILGEVNEEACEILQNADDIFIQELKQNDLYNQTWQAFAVLLNVKSVGVMGDNRTYENTVALRAINSLDGMTATVSNLSMEFLSHVSTRIINEVAGVNRVVYDISTKPPSTIEWE